MPDTVPKQRKTGQAIIVFGWCPSKNKAIAMQVDEHGRLVIDPEELDTRYLKRDGSNELLNNLNFQTLMIKEIVSGSSLGVRLLNDSDYRDWFTRSLYTNLIQTNTAQDMYIRTGSAAATKDIIFQAYDVGASAYETVAQVLSHATNPVFQINKAGDIHPEVNDAADLGSAIRYFRSLYIYSIELNAVLNLAATGYVNFINGAIFVPSANVGADIQQKLYYDAPSDEIRVYDGAAWNVH